jgi:hypothetical protein
MALMSSRLSFPLLALWRALPALWLVAALLWAPIWGQWHGITHPLRLALGAPEVAATVLSAPIAADEGHAQGSALCQVLDHLGHANGLIAWPVQAVFVALSKASPAGVAHSEPAARTGWTLQARAPPHWI